MIKFVIMEATEKTTMNAGVLEKPPVGFTPTAVEELKRLYSSLELKEASALRIGVKGGGCSGMSYMLAFDKPEDSDQHYEIEGIPVVMNKAHVMYVLGMEVDWENGLNNRGFSFNNPNASSTCGCGQSFAV